MKRSLKIITLTVTLATFSTGVALASSTNLFDALIQGISTNVMAIKDQQSAQSTQNLQDHAKKISTDIEDYNEKFIDDIQKELQVYQQDYTQSKVQELERLKTQYQESMNAEKEKKIKELKDDLKKDIDKAFDQSITNIIKDLS